jgi:NitT/TauT family transport system substrate-binding protein
MKVVESGWGTTTFETGALDVLAAFAYDEPVQLDLKNVTYDEIHPEAYDVRYVGTVYFTSGAMVRDNAEAVQSLMNNLVAGWQQALKNPQEAIRKLSVKFSSLDTKKELLSLERGRQYFAGENGRLLYASRERWEEMGRHLVDLQALKQFDFQSNVDYRFLVVAQSTSNPK